MALQDAFELVANVGQKSGDIALQTAPVAASQVIAAQRDKVNDERRQRYYKENQRDLFHYSQLSQKMAAKNEVEGLRRAGLSPALAGGASGMSVATASAPSGAAGAPTPDVQNNLVDYDRMLAASQLETGHAQRELLRSEAELNDARTTGVMIDNENKEGANFTLNAAYDDVLNAARITAEAKGDKSALAVIDALSANGQIIKNAGGFRAMREALDAIGDYPDVLARRVENFSKADIIGKQMSNPSVVNSLVMSPYWENHKIRAQIGELGAMALKLASDAKANEHLLPSIDMKVDEIRNEMEHIDVSDEIAKHNDLAGMIKSGDWLGAGTKIVSSAFEIAASIAGIYIGARTHARNMPFTKVDVDVDNSTTTNKTTSSGSGKRAPSLEEMTERINRQRAQRQSRFEHRD